MLQDYAENEVWQRSIAELLSDFTDLLRDAFAVMHELQCANEQSDLSYLHQPSISDHPQNQRIHDWTALIDLTRDAWIATQGVDPNRARVEVARWYGIPYPIFRR